MFVIEELPPVFRVDFFKAEGITDQLTPLDNERLSSAINNTLQALQPRLKDFHQVLMEPPKVGYLIIYR